MDEQVRYTLREILQACIAAGDLIQPDDHPPDNAADYLEAIVQIGGEDWLDETVYIETELYGETSERAWSMLEDETPERILDQGTGWRLVKQIHPVTNYAG